MSAHWQNKRATASHADDWLMTYADMITLLLCFFVIFLIISISKNQHKDPAPQTVAATTTNVTVAVQQPDIPPPATKYPDIMQGNLPFHDRDPDDYADNDAYADKSAATTHTDAAPAPVADAPKIEEAPAPTSAPVAPVIAAPQGDRISAIEMSSAAFFTSGSAELSEGGKQILQPVAAELKSGQYKGYRITVEGYTDDTPIHTAQFPSNWELSSARAAAVVQFFLHEGLPAQRMRAAGYADSFPKAPNRDAEGRAIPANQALNRRVVIELEKIDTAKEAAPPVRG